MTSLAPRTRSLLLTAALVTTALTSVAFGQATWSTQVLIPDLLTISVPTTILSFTIGQNPGGTSTAPAPTGPSGCPVASTYPPPTFPACYPLDLSGSVLPVQVFSNIRGSWSILLDVANPTNQTGTAQIEADHIWYRVGDGSWARIQSTSNPLYFGSGVTDGYQQLDVYFMLELDGSEHAGSFTANAVVSAIQQP